jgi:two-component system sensor histidine kinase RstB
MNQLHRLEFAAKALSLGNLSTRIDEDQAGPLINVATAINQLAAQTQSLLTTQRELMQAVSHELKTPLSRIQFAVELLEAEQDVTSMRGRVDVMRTAAVEMDEMVNRLLQYVKSEAPRSTSPRWQVPLEPVVNEIFDGERPLHANLTYELDEKIVAEEISVLTNVPDLTCVISNTIRNASRFAKQVIRVSAYRTSKGVIIDIDDDGPGIPEKQRKRVFRPFERLSDERGSAGLGLALVGRILTRHGGWAKAESSPLGGCRIRTFWPRRTR